MEKQLVTVALVGMGGYGSRYVKEIIDRSEAYGMNCVGMVDIAPEKCEYYHEVISLGIPIYHTIEELYVNHSPQLIFIATPIQFHCRHICYALEHGSHVLCEKPTAATSADAKLIIEKAYEAKRFVAIGYQKCYSNAVLKAKEDVLAGRYGQPKVYKCLATWQRNISYFERGWAGKIKIGEDFINDSIANNACAHHLNHLFFMAGKALNQSAFPESIEAECYRVNEIENYDTVTIKMVTENGVRLYFAGTHCAKESYAPYIVCEFENGRIVFDETRIERPVIGYLKNGEVIEYGSMMEDNFRTIFCAVEAVRGRDTIYCDAITAFPHSIVIQYIQDNVPIQDWRFKAELLNKASDDNPRYMKYVEGLGKAMLACFQEEKMLSDEIL